MDDRSPLRALRRGAAVLSALAGVLVTTVAGAAVSVPPPDAGNNFAVRDVRVFDGDKLLPQTTVVVARGRIVSVEPDAWVPRGGPVIDGRGKTLIPGLIDSHVHVFPGAQADALRFGVTTELDMFDIGGDLRRWKAQRESLARTTEADTWAAGLGTTVKGGAPLQDVPPAYARKIPTLADAKSAQAFVDARIAEGSDYIKLFIENLSEYHGPKSLPTLTRGEVCAVIAAAHRDGRIAIVHAQAEWAAREAIQCDADALAHMVPDEVVGPDFIALAKSHHLFVLTTDSVWAGASGIGLAAKLAGDPRVAPLLSAAQRQTLLAKETKVVASFYPNALANTRALHAAGVPVLAGTDAPNPATAHGVSLHEELRILVQAGFTPVQALHAATALPVAIFQLGDRGHIEPGFRADLVLLDGDPTRNIDDTLSIDRVWKNGFVVDRKPPPTRR